MCTLCLSDMGELRDDWLREPKPKAEPAMAANATAVPVTFAGEPSRSPKAHRTMSILEAAAVAALLP